MTQFQIVVLALVHGVTEFLPINAAGHLALFPAAFGWPDQGITIGIAVNLGMLGAVSAYLWREIWMMLRGLARLAGGRIDDGARLAGYVAVASGPVAAAGLLLHLAVPTGIGSIKLIGWSFVGFGALLWLADLMGLRVRRLDHMTAGKALMIGVAQAFALIPGASRAGTAITMARLLGFERRDAARFSMLMSIPAIIGSGLMQSIELAKSGNAQLQPGAFAAGAFAFVGALLAILAMMGWLRRASYTPFVLYRLAAGVAILWIGYRYAV